MTLFRPDARGAAGSALVVTLCVLLAVMIVGLGASRAALNAEKSARNERDRHIAFEAAEAALVDAERDIDGGADPTSARASLFGADGALGFVDGCGRAHPNLGLCRYAPGMPAPAWQLAGLADAGAASGATPYGTFTGAAMPVGAGVLPARAPRYIIERMPLAEAGADASAPAANFYRITAIGFGTREGTQVVLQGFYRRAMPVQAGLP
jgi:Tfp pilus assembly protein PilX